MSLVRTELIASHNKLVQLLETKYMHHINQLLLQKNVILIKMQSVFSQQMADLNEATSNLNTPRTIQQTANNINIQINHAQNKNDDTQNELKYFE